MSVESVEEVQLIYPSVDTTVPINKAPAGPRWIGQVKWFNSKAGYGFITAREGDMVDRDIFVHYSSIGTDENKYKYLVQGEYVEYALSKPTRGDHEYIAISVSGVRGGELMCDVRKQIQEKRTGYSPRVYKTPDESPRKRPASSASRKKTPSPA